MSNEQEIQEYEKLIQLISGALEQDANLRTKYGVVDKFRFVRDRLQALLTHLEEEQKSLKKAESSTVHTEENTNKALVYVYLYNAQGMVLRSWLTLLTPRVFYEYSVNRPIYAEKSHVESLLKNKANKHQHAYLTVKLNQQDILTAADMGPKDAQGNPVIKIREGSLSFENLVTFTHNGQDYSVSAQGEFIKK